MKESVDNFRTKIRTLSKWNSCEKPLQEILKEIQKESAEDFLKGIPGGIFNEIHEAVSNGIQGSFYIKILK